MPPEPPQKAIWNKERNTWEYPLNEVSESLYARRLKLLPKLNLKYPPPSELIRLAGLAGVKDQSDFGRHLRGIIQDAYFNYAIFQATPVQKIDALSDIERHASRLRRSFETVEVGASDAAAGLLLEHELGRVSFKGQLFLVPAIKELLELLSTAVANSVELAKPRRGRPMGGGGNYAFNILVQNLEMAARQRGGHFTKGAWVKVFSILEPHLPTGLIPRNVDILRSVQHALKQLPHVAKNPRQHT
jgi:hypothetical protein